jgi:bacillolysin
MKKCALLVFIALLMAVTAGASDETQFGPNKLRGNKNVTTYRENEKYVPTFIEGNLMSSVQPGNEVSASLTFFADNKGAFGMKDPSEELRVKRSDQDDLGMRHIRFEQLYMGLPVISGELVTHFTAAGQLKTVNGNYEPLINIDPVPVLTAQEAISAAEKDLLAFFGSGLPGNPELVVFPWNKGYYLSWRLLLYSDSPMGRWEYFIDAKSGEVIYKANRIMNANDIGIGVWVMGDTIYHIDTHYSGSVYNMIDYTRQLNNNPHGHNGQMPDGNYLQTNMATTSLPGTVASDADNLWFSGTSQAAAVSGHTYTALVYDWLLSAFGRNGYNGSGASMLTVVNYSLEGNNNAYWDGSRIVIWSWSSGWRSLAGCPDVIAHEWGHAVTENCSNLIYEKEPGALNESFSDMMGTSFEWAHDSLDTPDWLMGENGQISGGAFRSMSDPHAYGDPDYYGTSDPYWVDVVNCTPSYLNDYCGVHTNCGVGNKWFYLLSAGGTHHDVTVTGIDIENAIKVAYRANAYYWTSTSNYADAALGTISAAIDLDPTGEWASQAANAWNAVGVETPGPSLLFSYPSGVPVTLVPGEPTTFEVVVSGVLGGTPVPGSGRLFYSINGGAYVNGAMTVISPNHYEATLPAAGCDTTIKFYVRARETNSGYFFDPDTTSPYTAMVATDVTVVFEDNFETDKGWTVTGDAGDGQWNRGIPAGGGARGDPPTDFDGSGKCYLTDNVYGNSDVDDGTTTLISPVFDLAGSEGLIHYARWYSNNFGSAPYSDQMNIYISNNNGGSWVLLETVGPVEQASGGWYERSIWVSEYITPTNQMRLRFDASDLGDGSVVEAAVDDVVVTAYTCSQGSQPAIMTESLPDWTVDIPYSVQLEASGGTGTLLWSDKNDDLIGTGLALSSSGLLSGTPLSSGPIAFTAQVIDEMSQSDEQYYSFDINGAVEITTETLPDWTIGRPYSSNLESVGGTPPINWDDKYDNLAGTGLSLSAGGLLSGTPTMTGQISFTAYVADGPGDDDENLFSFTINPAVTITTTSLPDGVEGEAYSYQLVADGGTGAKAWTDKNNELDGTGLTLSAEGLLAGTPVSPDTITFTARAEDIVGSFDEETLGLIIGPAFICGDANGDEVINLLDITFIIAYVYMGGPAPIPVESADVNGEGNINILDITYLINFIYNGGPNLNCP